jgi:hypothetical protein
VHKGIGPWRKCSCIVHCALHAPIAHHLVSPGGINLHVGIVHEAVDADAGAEDASEGEAELQGVGRGIGEPVLLGVGASHSSGLLVCSFGRDKYNSNK